MNPAFMLRTASVLYRHFPESGIARCAGTINAVEDCFDHKTNPMADLVGLPA
ncbi:hypothetical protein AB0L82_14050 [Nocardia sp. NPDC052001]|uniref:hypothetical protein n=1 Tax=Nocardia sp. NPDC052001 TaxID=3154853 RepID=UPI0034199B18